MGQKARLGTKEKRRNEYSKPSSSKQEPASSNDDPNQFYNDPNASDSGSDAPAPPEDEIMADVPNDNTTLEEELNSMVPQEFHQTVYKEAGVAQKLRDWYFAQPGQTEKLEDHFERFNKQIRSFNKKNGLDENFGTIPLDTVYGPHKELAEPLLMKLKKNKQDSEAKKEFMKIRAVVTQINQNKGFDESWGFPADS